MKVLLTNTSSRAERLAVELEKRGMNTIREPMLSVHGRPWLVSSLEDQNALVVTSPNSAPFLANVPNRMKGRPVFTVGPSTGAAMQQAGFSAVISAGGTAVDLARMIRQLWSPSDGGLTYVSGHQVSEDLSAVLRSDGYAARRVIVYQTNPRSDFSAPLRENFQNKSVGCCVFMSPFAAARFSMLAHSTDVSFRSRAVVISSRVAAKLDPRCWDIVATSLRPTLQGVIETIVKVTSDRRWRPWDDRQMSRELTDIA